MYDSNAESLTFAGAKAKKSWKTKRFLDISKVNNYNNNNSNNNNEAWKRNHKTTALVWQHKKMNVFLFCFAFVWKVKG